MKTVLGIGVVAELLGVCLAFAPTAVFPTPRSYRSSFTPQLTRCYKRLASTEGNVHRASCFTCSHVDPTKVSQARLLSMSRQKIGSLIEWNRIECIDLTLEMTI